MPSVLGSGPVSQRHVHRQRSRPAGVLPGDERLVEPDFQPGIWVQLLVRPADANQDEALLLAPDRDQHWLVWIPGHGQAYVAGRDLYPLQGIA